VAKLRIFNEGNFEETHKKKTEKGSKKLNQINRGKPASEGSQGEEEFKRGD